jgi:hypothetical protein
VLLGGKKARILCPRQSDGLLQGERHPGCLRVQERRRGQESQEKGQLY